MDIDEMNNNLNALCSNMILHLNSGLSKANINIILDITNKIKIILDTITDKIEDLDLTETKELKKHTMNLRSAKKGIEVIGNAPPYPYYNQI